MNSIQITKQLNSSLSITTALSQALSYLAKKWVATVGSLLVGVSLALAGLLITEHFFLLASIHLITLLGCVFIYLVLLKRNIDNAKHIRVLRHRIAGEASATRILQGVKLLNKEDPGSAESRLAISARIATNYDAVIIFNLQHTHGALIPSYWSCDSQPNNIEAEFEPLTESSPGASAVRQGAAIVMSTNHPEAAPIPGWAKQSGFQQGIVSPIFNGLDTVGVLYALTKKATLPTIAEIEQLELILSFRSIISPNNVSNMFKEGFRTSDIRNTPEIENRNRENIMKNLTIGSFSLNEELVQMKLSGTAISLSPTEFQLMHTLASSSGVPVSPARLLSACWGEGTQPSERALDVAIFRLRKKLKTIQKHTGLIKTVRGSGYMFDDTTINPDSAEVGM